MKPLISIIVPVYNVEKYLRKCVDSIVKQTYSNIEILLIDDGSTDNSGKICDEIAETDSRIKIFHKENGGLSSARNFGIERSKGTYIGFVDSDDYIDEDMYEILIKLIEENDADLSMCALYDVYEGKARRNNISFTLNVGKEDAIRMVLEAEIVSVTAVNKLYKKELFDEIRYPEGKTAEDAFVIVDLLNKCNKIAITSAQKYYYIHRSGSITTRKFNGNVDAIEAYEKNFEIIKRYYPDLIEVAQMRVCWANFYVLDRLLFDDREEYKKIKNQIINYLNNSLLFVLTNRQFHISRKVAAIMLRVNWRLYKLCIVLHNKRNRIE